MIVIWSGHLWIGGFLIAVIAFMLGLVAGVIL